MLPSNNVAVEPNEEVINKNVRKVVQSMVKTRITSHWTQRRITSHWMQRRITSHWMQRHSGNSVKHLRSQQTHHVDSTLKRRGNDSFHVVSTWNPCEVFVGIEVFAKIINRFTCSNSRRKNYKKVWNMFNPNNKDTSATSMVLFIYLEGYVWLFHREGPNHKETSSLICRVNQWTDFYVIQNFVMKELIPLPLVFKSSQTATFMFKKFSGIWNDCSCIYL